eukprot:GHRQ01001165.1.p1 GENE.GHRQ01001165.1~~GHRQ01001165.1.p1  ORF type:complete len:300 (+),score=139.20 GHRQ01001165.1:206-1105(+)
MPLTTAGLISGWTYPLRGVVHLTKAPELRNKVSRFLVSITATSAATSAAWLWFFYSRHVRLISQVFGMAGGSLLAHFAAGVLVLAESTLPVYVLFSRQFEQLQGTLFDATLQLQGITISPMQPRDREALAAAVGKVQQQRAAEKAAADEAWRKGGLASKATQLLLGGVTDVSSLATQLLLKPQPYREGLLVRQARRLVTVAAGTLVPPLLPLLALRDSGAVAVRLLSKYWDRKGVPRDADSRAIVAKQHSGELRSFGLVAGGLGSLPLLNWVLGLSNMVGAALLVADMEKKQGALFVRQ